MIIAASSGFIFLFPMVTGVFVPVNRSQMAFTAPGSVIHNQHC